MIEDQVVSTLNQCQNLSIPFKVIAGQQNLTMQIGRKRSYLDEVLYFRTQFAKNSSDRTDLLQRVKDLRAEQQADRAIMRIKQISHINDDIRLREKYQKLQTKLNRVMPMILQTECQELIKTTMSTLRCHLPKAFFKTAQKAMRNQKGSQMALGFQSTIDPDGTIEDPPLIEDYIANLYDHVPLPIPSEPALLKEKVTHGYNQVTPLVD
jgi:hypothetical protein